MLLFVPTAVTLPCIDQPQPLVIAQSSVPALTVEIPPPGAPLFKTIPLPGSNALGAADAISLEQDLLPLNIFTDTSATLQSRLGKIRLTSPIHLHVLNIHLGIFGGEFPGQTFSALEVLMSLRSLAMRPLEFHSDFSHLPHFMKSRVMNTYLGRATPGAFNVWEKFISGQQPSGGPTGYDLLLGMVDVWGFESVAFSGYSAIHLA